MTFDGNLLDKNENEDEETLSSEFEENLSDVFEEKLSNVFEKTLSDEYEDDDTLLYEEDDDDEDDDTLSDVFEAMSNDNGLVDVDVDDDAQQGIGRLDDIDELEELDIKMGDGSWLYGK